MTEIPRGQAVRSLIDVIGPMTDEQAARALAIFNRHLRAAPATTQVDTPDAA